MRQRVARGVMPCVPAAASGSYRRADIRLQANVRLRTCAPTAACIDPVAIPLPHPSVESVFPDPIRYLQIQP